MPKSHILTRLLLTFCASSLSLAAETLLTDDDFHSGPALWASSTGAQQSGNALTFSPAAFANSYTGISPQEKTTYTFAADLSSAAPAAAKLTVFLYLEQDTTQTRNAAVSEWRTGFSGATEVNYTTESTVPPGWKIGVQILGVEGTVEASNPVLSSTPAVAPLVLEGGFGRAEADPEHPGLVSLQLRRPDGSLEPKSLLSDAQWHWERGGPEWATGGYTYVRDVEGQLYESRLGKAEYSDEDSGIIFKGIELKTNAGAEPVATEEWTLKPEEDALVWTVTRTWLKSMTVRHEGTPALFMSMRGLAGNPTANVPNGVVSTLWVHPDQLAARFDPLYRPAWGNQYKLSRNNVLWLTKPNQWAIHKLFGNWDNASDLRVAPEGGHLYRRGFFGWVTETGTAIAPEEGIEKKQGTIETATLRISPVDKMSTGHQLKVEIPDKPLQERLTSYYGSLFNGAQINDPLNFNFGNETDGWYYGGGVWMQGFALNAGVPAADPLAEVPYDLTTAFRNHLAAVIGASGPDGRSVFGYNHSGDTVDDNVFSVIGVSRSRRNVRIDELR